MRHESELESVEASPAKGREGVRDGDLSEASHRLAASAEAMIRRRRSPLALRGKVARLSWVAVQSVFFRYSFHTWSRWRALLLRLFGARIGRGCTIRRTAKVYYPWLFEMGDVSSLGDRAEIYNLGPVRLGDRVTVSQEAYLCAGSHDYRFVEMPLTTPAISIGDDSWICARAFVGPGVDIAEGTIVAACAVVTKNTAPWTIVGGNPAVVIGQRPALRSLSEGS